VLGQIHAKDVSAATVKLLWEGKTKPVRVILNKSTEKSAFSVSLGTIKDPSKPWSYQIKMTDEGIELSAGGVHKKLAFGKELSDDWKKETFYFKAGLYPQINKNSGGAFAATFSKLSILHSARPGDFGTHVPLVCDPAVSDCSCVEQDENCTWWDVPLPTPTIPATPLATNKPGQNFDLTGWYLSQPFDHDMNGKPDDVFEWHLAQGYEHPEMFYTADDGGLVFKSFNKGVRTSQNTKYVRTELREMLRAGDRSIPLKGVNKNNWVFSSAPVEDQKAAAGIDGVLEATLKIDHTTTSGEANQVGRFIIGQIHDQDDEPIRLYYRKLPSQDTGTVYFAHENTLKGTDTYFDLVGGMNGVTDDGIALGEVFSYRIEVVGNTMTVTLMREGKDDAVQVVDMSESGYDQGGRYMYFKAGVYNQNNSGDPEDYVQATFYKLEKSHSQFIAK
jgi:poly(beta-D-mannuronate) lyase